MINIIKISKFQIDKILTSILSYEINNFTISTLSFLTAKCKAVQLIINILILFKKNDFETLFK